MHTIGTNLIYHLLRLIGKLPLKYHYCFAKMVSWTLSEVIHYRKGTVYTNLARSFPDMNYEEIDDLVKEFYNHAGEIIAEAIWFTGSSSQRLKRQGICTITNPEVLASCYDRSPSVMVLTSHSGNWELSGGLRLYNTDPRFDYAFDEEHICVAYKQQSSRLWNEILKRTRTSPIGHFDGLVESRQILRYALERCDEKNIYIFIADQAPYGKATHIGEFMHQDCYGMAAGVRLAQKGHMSVLYSSMVRTRRGHYEITYVPLTEDAGQDEPQELLAKYFKELQKDIESAPANYLWSHKRWKKPTGQTRK